MTIITILIVTIMIVVSLSELFVNNSSMVVVVGFSTVVTTVSILQLVNQHTQK